jgi:ureidoglycolate hydrolase
MNQNWLEVREYHGQGYRPLIDYGEWRVAILCYIDELRPDRIDRMERHCQTDEVFVLLQGHATLLLGGNGSAVEGVFPQEMETNKLFNVKQNAWHSILLSQDASVLIVENRDTSEGNSQYCPLSAELCQQIIDLGRQGKF